jgi:tetratricopeptide (TPR) repeat protein
VLEELYEGRTEEIGVVLAHHWERAEEFAKAAEYLRRAGKEFEKVSPFDAMGAFERALALLPEGDVAGRAHLLASLGYVYRLMGRPDVSMPYLEGALMLSRKAGIKKTEAFALRHLSDVAYRQGRFGEAERHLGRAMDLAREINDPNSMACALNRLISSAVWQEGDIEKAERYAKEGLALTKEISDEETIAAMLLTVSGVATFRGEHGESKRYKEEALATYREIGDQMGVAACLNNLGEDARWQGKYAEAVRYYEEALAIYTDIGISNALTLNNLGHAYIGLDEDDVAWGYLCKALREFLVTGRVPLILESLAGVAWLRAKAGHYTQAAELLGLVLGHPALGEGFRWYLDQVLATVREALPTDELEAALERGKRLDLEQVVAEILKEAE